jgi:hypothetical protein
MSSIRFRLQEALAERFRWVQYPRQTFLPGGVEPQRFRLVWANQMPLWQRLFIGCMSLLLLIVSIVLMFLIGDAIYLFVSALVSS